jgi:hypothetical protein
MLTVSPTVGGYTPTVGDTVSINGTYSPFDGFPEMATVTANTLNSQGNSTPTLPNYQGLSTGTYQDPDTQHLGTSMVYSLGTLIAASTNTLTVSAGTVSSTILPIGIGSTILTLENVYVSGGTAFNSFNPTATNQTGTITDLSGGTDGLSMELFYWPTSYSVPLADLGGRALPSTPVNVTGFMDLFSGVPEFVPIDIRNASNNSQLTLVPEPGTLSLLGAGVTVAGAIFIRRRFGRSAKYNLPGSGNGLSFAGSGMNSA